MGSLPCERRLSVDSVCIIGAGPSGLAAAKYLLAECAFSRIVIYEQRANVGGIWNYVPIDLTAISLNIPQTSSFAEDEQLVSRHSNTNAIVDQRERQEVNFLTPLYDRLETNIPRGLMGFSDLPWPDECQLFPQHERVLEYIERYAEDVRHLIRFNTQVINVRLVAEERWSVRTQSVATEDVGAISEDIFDAVVVANGHFNVPYIPDVLGIRDWNEAYPGAISHSKFYRQPEHYAGKKVVIVGNSASGIDIGAQIQQLCRPPLLLSSKSESFLVNSPSPTKLDMPPITKFTVQDRSVQFCDGTVEKDVDAVLYCTGYLYSFPFLRSLSPPLLTTGEHVHNLYQHIFYRPHPTLAFPVLNQKVIPFPLAEAQSAVIARVFSGRLRLPEEKEMKEWEEYTVRTTGSGRQFHVLKFPRDADYINMCHDWARSADREGTGEQDINETESNDHGNCSAWHARKANVGKRPPYWDEKAYWTRERFPAIKKAFQDFGEARHSKRTLEDVGFNYEAWKRARQEQAETLP